MWPFKKKKYWICPRCGKKTWKVARMTNELFALTICGDCKVIFKWDAVPEFSRVFLERKPERR